jgi:hypothetical protein
MENRTPERLMSSSTAGYWARPKSAYGMSPNRATSYAPCRACSGPATTADTATAATAAAILLVNTRATAATPRIVS